MKILITAHILTILIAYHLRVYSEHRSTRLERQIEREMIIQIDDQESYDVIDHIEDRFERSDKSAQCTCTY